jgi:hypothetical protein
MFHISLKYLFYLQYYDVLMVFLFIDYTKINELSLGWPSVLINE